MKHLQSAILAILMIFGMSQVQAATDPINSATKDLQVQISKMIQNNRYLKSLDTDQTVKISFMINRAGEIVVLTTDNKELDETMKNILNYKKIKVHPSLVNNIYHIPVTIHNS